MAPLWRHGARAIDGASFGARANAGAIDGARAIAMQQAPDVGAAGGGAVGAPADAGGGEAVEGADAGPADAGTCVMQFLGPLNPGKQLT
jgi:hypothetical protein